MNSLVNRRRVLGGKEEPVVLSSFGPLAEKIISIAYNNGLCKHEDYMTASEAALVTSINSQEGESLNRFESDLSYFQYFINAELISTYAIQGAGNGLIIIPPYMVAQRPGVRRFHGKCILLSSTPRPLFNGGPAPYAASGNKFYECSGTNIYVPDGSVEAWQPYVDCAAYSLSWQNNTNITLHAISELSDEIKAKIKIKYS